MAMTLPQNLSHALRQPLPGVEAQLLLAHPARSLDVPAGVVAREAGVLILLYPQRNGIYFPLIQRPDLNPHDQHRGQISLPGGKRDADDASITVTALREAEEEVGVAREQVEVLGQLSTLYIPVSNFAVTPTVAWTPEAPVWLPQPGEVEQVYEVPLASLHDADVVRHTDISLNGNLTLRDVPYFSLAGQVVWGATAMMLSELRQVVAQLD